MLTLLRWGNDGTTEGNILWKIRLSRLLGAALLGGALSIAGFLLQTFFKNPIAGPFVLGISSGSRLFVGFFLLAATPIVTGASPPTSSSWRPSPGHWRPWLWCWPCPAGAEPSHAAGHRHDDRLHLRRGHRLHDHLRREQPAPEFTIWTMGSFSGMTWATLGPPPDHHPHGGAGVSPVQALGAYLLGENYAKSMGVNVKGFRVA